MERVERSRFVRTPNKTSDEKRGIVVLKGRRWVDCHVDPVSWRTETIAVPQVLDSVEVINDRLEKLLTAWGFVDEYWGFDFLNAVIELVSNVVENGPKDVPGTDELGRYPQCVSGKTRPLSLGVRRGRPPIPSTSYGSSRDDGRRSCPTGAARESFGRTRRSTSSCPSTAASSS